MLDIISIFFPTGSLLLSTTIVGKINSWLAARTTTHCYHPPLYQPSKHGHFFVGFYNVQSYNVICMCVFLLFFFNRNSQTTNYYSSNIMLYYYSGIKRCLFENLTKPIISPNGLITFFSLRYVRTYTCIRILYYNKSSIHYNMKIAAAYVYIYLYT